MSGSRESTIGLAFEGVSKTYSRDDQPVHALRDVSLHLRGGRIVGIFGNNGAGKTTLLRLAAGLLEPDRGRVCVGDRDMSSARLALQRGVGLAGTDERTFYPRLSGAENLLLYGRLYGLRRAEVLSRTREWASRLEMEHLLAHSFQTYSSGQRQRLNLIRAFLHEPEVVLLDEATRSADPATVDAVRDVLLEQAHERGTLILYTGHEFRGLEDTCDDIVVLDRGSVVLAGPSREVLGSLVGPAWRLHFHGQANRDCALELLSGLSPDELDECAALWPQECVAGERGLPPEIVELTRHAGVEVTAIERRDSLSVRELLLRLASGRGEVEALNTLGARVGGEVEEAQPIAGRGVRVGGTLPLLAALLRRDRRIHLSYRFKLILQGSLMIVWATLFYFIAQLLDPERTPGLHGDPFGFLLLGLATLQVSQVCLLHMGHTLREEQLTGTLESLIATGGRPVLLLLGSLTWPLCLSLGLMGALLGSGTWIMGADLSQANWLALGVATALFCLPLVALGVLSAAFVMAFKRGDPVAMLIHMASLILAGAYFPRELLPGWAQELALLIPHTHGLEAVRAAALDGAGFGDAGFRAALGSLGVCAAVVVPLAGLGWSMAVRHARRRGTICHV